MLRVLDGDSVLLTDGNEVRYLGINADEAGDPFSEEARMFNRRLVEGKQVRLGGDRERRFHWPDGFPGGTVGPTALTMHSPTGEVMDRVRLPTSTSREDPKREGEL